jgi:nucleotide-binding universal stress UspA family protein
MDVKPPYGQIIAAIDGSALSGIALLGASLLAAQGSAELVVLHAASSSESAESARAQATDVLGSQPYRLEIRELKESASRTIAEYAQDSGETAIVAIGTHGRGGVGASLLGSTAVDLVTRAGQSILAYGPAAGHPIEIERVVACVDGSEFSELSVSEATRWAAALRVPLWLIQVVAPDAPPQVRESESAYVHNLARELPDLGTEVQWEVLHSLTPARSIVEWHGNDAAVMFIMATHGRVGLQRVLMGSVSSQVVKDAWGPVALIRPSI